MANEVPNKKRHHYIPQTYLRHFCDEEGRLWVFPKDSPTEPFRTTPSSIALERYYYSQPTPEGGVDHNRLEDFFAGVEGHWNEIVARWGTEDPANDKLDNFFEFLALTRARVPAARDMVELALADSVMVTMRLLIKKGELDPPPKGLRLEDIVVTIDPHKSIEAMASVIKGMTTVVGRIGFEIVYNDTEINLITTDNPVCYFDPSVSEGRLRPYTIHPVEGPIELLFPVAPDLMLRGHSDLKFEFGRQGMLRRRSRDREEVKRFNRMVARFGYRLVFASNHQSVAVVEKYAPLSPVISKR